MKKVLYICPTSSVGGAETFVLQTATSGDTSQFENHYLLFRTGPLYDKLSQTEAQIHLIHSPPKLSSLKDRKRITQKIKEIVNAHNIQLIHSTMAYSALFAASISKQMGIPHVWFQHGPASGWMDRLAAILPHNGLIVNSHFTGKMQRQLENPVRFLIPRKKPIEKILLGTEVIEFNDEVVKKYKDRFMTQWSLHNPYPLIGMLCRIQEWKGVHLFIDAIQELKRTYEDTPFYGVIWGESFKSDDYLKNLKSRVDKDQLPVIFAGHSDNPKLSLAACDALVNASTQPEPFGLSIIEAMMVGTIPIVPDHGGPS
jgi:glycosyltransferase involved in cell wall biosynthesis